MPFSGKGKDSLRPEGNLIDASLTISALTKSRKSKPSSSLNLRAIVVKPSPQHLSRGNSALSMRRTDLPLLATVHAADEPAGPAPTTTTS